MLAGKKDPRRIFDHVITLVRVSRNDGSRENIVVIAGSVDWDEGVGASWPVSGVNKKIIRT